MKPYPYRLLAAIGIELEYMIVDGTSLDVKPISDELIKAVVGQYESEIELDDIAWSNELVLHVIELKTNGPVRTLAGLAPRFQANVEHVNAILKPLGAKLLPTAMHPWMDPYKEMRLWPHEYTPVYDAFDRIFNCKGHGWANLQSTHINLAFGNNYEFGQLHAAIRLILPILPALAASSPLKDGKLTGLMDTRVEVYRHNADRIPQVAGQVIPERAFTRREYEAVILHPIYQALEPHDPEGVLRHEWANSRGCIARFDRGAIEIRLLDIQECPLADIAIANTVVSVVRALCNETLCDFEQQKVWEAEPLAAILLDTARSGEKAIISNKPYLETLGLTGRQSCTAAEIWAHLIDLQSADPSAEEFKEPLEVLVEHGCLARRIERALGDGASRDRLHAVYEQLSACLHQGRMFVPS
ncbi:MAG: glutamate-cysteine ligase family protein [Myxococcota bacterium]